MKSTWPTPAPTRGDPINSTHDGSRVGSGAVGVGSRRVGVGSARVFGYRQREMLALGLMPNTSPQRKVSILVEYRL